MLNSWECEVRGMRKKELLGMHQLLHLVADHLSDTEESFDCSDYNDLAVGPKSVHKPKGEHEEAVFALVDAVTTAVNDADDGSEGETRKAVVAK